MILGYKEINNFLKENNLIDYKHHSAVNVYDNLKKAVEYLKPEIVLEIGTFNGLSTAILANLCSFVFTVDIAYRPETQVVWDHFNLLDKINYSIFKDREEIGKFIKKIQYDFVYIDANHKYEEVKADYEMIKDCNSILFHDYHLDGVRQLINEIDGQPLAEFAYKGTQQVKGHYKMEWKTDPLFLGKILENNY